MVDVEEPPVEARAVVGEIEELRAQLGIAPVPVAVVRAWNDGGR
jgi:hypothetical protein